ncbi:MAG: hypothetical protein K6T81_08200 [Alicyclobacillus macrosporangiidus]|uniref:hypothetical protein n=1 Tax=Alicyclobacillus macrosporangiidus TaxID=392015 RepID=UPI0026EFB439|nr:hypothetical protein [Alicyclobacillus macrosporangiidus]MCL6598708.1 hypothetical protein [Alicyclobacillus macrosporangiidus]
MNETLATTLTQLYQDVLALIDIVRGQLALLSETTTVPPDLEKGFAARKERVPAVLHTWREIAAQLPGVPETEELQGRIQKLQLAVQLFLELDKKLVEQLNARSRDVMRALEEKQRLVRGLACYHELASMADGVTEILLRNPSRWIDERR